MIRIRELQNKPLVEAIVELRWRIDPEKGDPNYSIFVGRLYNILESKYTYHEPLPTSMMPEQIAGNIVQHRFRAGENGWPLVQVGPGIVTLNETEKYNWGDFGERANRLARSVYRAYPKAGELKMSSLLLRYIDAVEIEHISKSVLDYVKDKLKVSVVLPRQLFESGRTDREAKAFNLVVAYQTKRPKGTITLRLGIGKKKGNKALVWETAVQSVDEELPSLPNGFRAWLKAAHNITDDWFFRLIEGELEREFAGE